MQLLEQLAGNNRFVTESELLCECGEVSGYLECVNDMISIDVVNESEVVLEGIDIMGFVKKIVGVILGLLKKLWALVKKFINFITGKKQKPVEEPKKKPSFKEDAEKVRAALAKLPYTGPLPLSLIRSPYEAFNMMRFAVRGAEHNINRIIDKFDFDEMSGWLTLNIATGELSDVEKIYDKIHKRANDMKYLADEIIKGGFLVCVDKDNKPIYSKYIKGPHDYSTAPLKIYEEQLAEKDKDSRTAVHIVELASFSNWQGFLNDVIENQNNQRDKLNESLKKLNTKLEDSIKQLNEFDANLTKISNGNSTIDSNVAKLMQLHMSDGQKALTNCGVCINYLSQGAATVISAIDADIDKAQKWYDDTSKKLKEQGLEDPFKKEYD